jgi:hypothetical protein
MGNLSTAGEKGVGSIIPAGGRNESENGAGDQEQLLLEQRAGVRCYRSRSKGTFRKLWFVID